MEDSIPQLFQETDISALATHAKQDAQTALLTTIATAVATNDPFNGYGLYAWNDDSTNFYAMYQNASGAWIIIKIVDATGVTTYSTGSSDALTNWTNRASLTYQDYSSTF